VDGTAFRIQTFVLSNGFGIPGLDEEIIFFMLTLYFYVDIIIVSNSYMYNGITNGFFLEEKSTDRELLEKIQEQVNILSFCHFLASPYTFVAIYQFAPSADLQNLRILLALNVHDISLPLSNLELAA